MSREFNPLGSRVTKFPTTLFVTMWGHGDDPWAAHATDEEYAWYDFLAALAEKGEDARVFRMDFDPDTNALVQTSEVTQDFWDRWTDQPENQELLVARGKGAFFDGWYEAF